MNVEESACLKSMSEMNSLCMTNQMTVKHIEIGSKAPLYEVSPIPHIHPIPLTPSYSLQVQWSRHIFHFHCVIC